MKDITGLGDPNSLKLALLFFYFFLLSDYGNYDDYTDNYTHDNE